MIHALHSPMLPDGLTVHRPAPTSAPTVEIQDWDNEGGSILHGEEAASPGQPRNRQRLSLRHRPEDKAAGCRDRAQADLARASAGGEGPDRWRYEHSAASWSQRADMLDLLDARRASAAPVKSAREMPDRKSVGAACGTAEETGAKLTRLHAQKFANGGFSRPGSFAHHSRVLRQSIARLAAPR